MTETFPRPNVWYLVIDCISPLHPRALCRWEEPDIFRPVDTIILPEYCCDSIEDIVVAMGRENQHQYIMLIYETLGDTLYNLCMGQGDISSLYIVEAGPYLSNLIERARIIDAL